LNPMWSYGLLIEAYFYIEMIAKLSFDQLIGGTVQFIMIACLYRLMITLPIV